MPESTRVKRASVCGCRKSSGLSPPEWLLFYHVRSFLVVHHVKTNAWAFCCECCEGAKGQGVIHLHYGSRPGTNGGGGIILGVYCHRLFSGYITIGSPPTTTEILTRASSHGGSFPLPSCSMTQVMTW